MEPSDPARTAIDLWFGIPPPLPEIAVPPGSEAFEVAAQGHAVRGRVWGAAAEPTVYLVHGWGGRGAQFSAFVEPLVQAGSRVVMFDMPAHGDSDPGPSGPGRSHGMEFARALGAVFDRYGPAAGVVAHSMGTIATYLALRDDWIATERLVFVAPMVSARPLVDQLQRSLGLDDAQRRTFDRITEELVGVSVSDFDARVQARHAAPRPVLLVADRDDRQTSYADAVGLAESIGAELLSTDGLGHHRILRDPTVVRDVVSFLALSDR